MRNSYEKIVTALYHALPTEGRSIPNIKSDLGVWQGKPTTGKTLYVDPQGYLEKRFSPRFHSMADAFKELGQGDTILLYGKIDESGLVGPSREITDVTICGMGTRTRPGHGGESAMAGAADWSNAKDNDTDPLLTIIAQGWSIRNMHFGGAKRSTSVRLSRTSSFTKSGSHVEFRNVAFSGGMTGIEDYGGATNVGIYNCQFYGYHTQPGATAIGYGTNPEGGMALPLMWEIVGNRFMNNDQHIVLNTSNSIVRDNVFFKVGYDFPRPNITMLDLSAGKNNIVAHNQFGCRSDEPGYANGAFKMAPGDAWGPNYCTDKEVYGAPTEIG